MRKLIAGLVLGLLLGAVPSFSEWAWGDMNILKDISTTLQWQARSLERIARVMERQQSCPCPPEATASAIPPSIPPRKP